MASKISEEMKAKKGNDSEEIAARTVFVLG